MNVPNRMMGFVVAVLCLLFVSSCGGSGESNSTPGSSSRNTFSSAFGGTGSEAAYSGLETSDGCFVLAGTKSLSTGNRLVLNSEDGYVVKTNSYGKKIWENYFGGDLDDGLRDIKETQDGGFVAVGYTYSFSSESLRSDAYLVKVNSGGNLLWYKTFDEGGSEVANSILVTAGGGFILVGTSDDLDIGSRKMYLVRTDREGNKSWSRMYGIGTYQDTAYSMTEASNGDFVIAGEAFFGASSGQNDIALLRIDKDGNEVWRRTFGGAYSDEARCVVRTSDNGFAIAGSIQTDMYSLDGAEMVLIKVDANGNELWRKTYKGTNEGLRANSIQQTSDEGFILVGNNPFAVGSYAVNLIKTDENGNELWRTTYAGTHGAQGNAVRVTSDGGFAVMGVVFSLDWQGFYNSDALILKTNANGQM